MRTFAARLAALGAGLLLISAITAAPAGAHAELLSVDPPDGSALEGPPAAVVFTFNEPLLPDFACFILPDQECGVDELPRQIDGNVVTIPWSEAAPPGLWEITYRVISQDGHEVRGSTSFSYEGPQPSPTPSPTETSPSPSPTQTTPAPQPTPTDPTASTPTASPIVDPTASPSTDPVADESGSTTGWLIAGLVVIALAIVTIIGLVMRRRNS